MYGVKRTILKAIGSGATSPSNISKIIGKNYSQVSTALAQMVDEGYLEKTRGLVDARIVNYSLTPEGKEILRGL